MKVNWMNKEESAKAVEEVKRKRTTKTTKKGTKKTQKKKKVSAWKKALRILVLWLIEIAVCAVIVATAWCINTIEGYLDVFELTHKQQDLIEELVHEITEITEIKTQYQAVEVKEMAYNLTESERELLAQLLYHEARGESLDCQKAVVSVVLNRVESGIWGDTLSEVIYAKNQFEPVARGLLPNTKPLQKQYEAIDYVLENGATIPEDVLYFRADHYFEWGTAYMSMDNTYFSF